MPNAFLTKIHEKQTKVGVMYDLEFSDGNKVGAGKFKPKGAEEGEYYKYEFTVNGNFKNLTAGSLSKQDKPAGVSAAPATKSYGSYGGDQRQTVISKQAALNSALTFVTLLNAAGALPIAKKELTTDKAADALLGVVDHYTDVFYKQSTGEDFAREDAVPSGLSAAEKSDTNWNE